MFDIEISFLSRIVIQAKAEIPLNFVNRQLWCFERLPLYRREVAEFTRIGATEALKFRVSGYGPSRCAIVVQRTVGRRFFSNRP